MFTNGRGDQIRLAQFADIHLGIGPSRLERFNRNSSVTLRAQATRPGAIAKQFMKALEQARMPQGVEVQATGDMKKMSDSMSVLQTAILLSLLLIYLSLVLLYNNWTDPLVVMISIPLSVVGALLALALNSYEYLCDARNGNADRIGSQKCNSISRLRQ